MRCTYKALVAYLKSRGTPFVEVSEAKRALFAGVRLRSFDVVAYSETGDNLLVTCRGFGEEGGAWGVLMARWQEVFGAGFVAVRAVLGRRSDSPPAGLLFSDADDGAVRFLDMDGKERSL